MGASNLVKADSVRAKAKATANASQLLTIYLKMNSNNSGSERCRQLLDMNLRQLKTFELRAVADEMAEMIIDNDVDEHGQLQRSFNKAQDLIRERAEHLERARNNWDSIKPSQYQFGVDDTRTLAQRASLSKAILDVSQGRALTGAEAEIDAEGRKQNDFSNAAISLPSWYTRATGTFGQDSTSASIANAVTGQQTLSADLVAARHAEPTAVQLGARSVDASGSASFLLPYLGKVDANSMAEGASDTSTADFQQTTLDPVRYNRSVTLSSLALRVGASSMDDIILQDMQAAHAAAVDRVAFTALRSGASFSKLAVDGSGNYPATTLAALFALVADYQTNAQSNEVPELICSPAAFEDLNSITDSNVTSTLAQAFTQATGVRLRPVVSMTDADFTIQTVATGGTDDEEITGAGLILAADFSDCVIAEWGGPQIVVDNYSAASQDLIKIHANNYVAAGLVRNSVTAFATTASALTPA